jgi:hypothetical protein
VDPTSAFTLHERYGPREHNSLLQPPRVRKYGNGHEDTLSTMVKLADVLYILGPRQRVEASALLVKLQNHHLQWIGIHVTLDHSLLQRL